MVFGDPADGLNITQTAGGFLDDGDIERIREMGVMKFFPRGTSFKELIDWSRANIMREGASGSENE